MTSKFLYLNFFALYSSSLWRTDTVVFAKFNRLPSQISPPSLLSPYPPQMFLKYISSPRPPPPPPPVGLIKDLRYLISSHANAILVKHFEMLFRLLSKEENWSQNASYNCFWGRYWGRAGQVLVNFLLSLVTVPEVFAKVNSIQFPSRCQLVSYHWTLGSYATTTATATTMAKKQ